jgi:Methyltransferase domain
MMKALDVGRFLLAFMIVTTLSVNSQHESNPKKLDKLTSIYLNYNSSEGFTHWIEYGKHYNRHLHFLTVKYEGAQEKLRLLEIGVQSGGSSRVWSKYFGEALNYTGIDINPKCKRFEAPELGIHIEIGSQLDVNFLHSICSRFGPFDIVVDDGGHTTEMIITSFRVLWHCMKDEGVYVMEDLHSAFLGREVPVFREDSPVMKVDGMDVFGHLAMWSKLMTSYFTSLYDDKRPQLTDPIARHIESISIYDSLAFLHYRENWHGLSIINKGTINVYEGRRIV